MSNYYNIVKRNISEANNFKMELLTKITNNFVEAVKDENADLYYNFLKDVDILMNPHFTKETAEYAVKNMKNKDGTTGQHWNMEQAEKALEKTGFSFNKYDWFYILNMQYSDYYKQGKPDFQYIEEAIDFLNDKDGPDDKAKRYYIAMHML